VFHGASVRRGLRIFGEGAVPGQSRSASWSAHLVMLVA
jgi:hypothetical protein